MRGPIDYIVVGFDGNKFDGSILQALTEAIDNGTIGLVSLAFVAKNSEGVVTTADLATAGDEAVIQFTQTYTPANSTVDQDDIDEVGELLEPDTAAGLLVIEQLWAKPLKKAIIDAGGFLLAEGRIHPEAVQELEGKE
jgi:Family of unknown function (DUF6325)